MPPAEVFFCPKEDDGALDLNPECDGAVVGQGDFHVGPELPGLGGDPEGGHVLDESFIEGFALCWGCST